MPDDKSEKETVGAWLLHHDQKLARSQTTEFETIAIAGRAARLLSSCAREIEWVVPKARVNELARANGIRSHEVSGLLTALVSQGLVDQANDSISVLGVSQTNLLFHAEAIFEANEPETIERAAIQLAELSSRKPVSKKDCAEQISDDFRISSTQMSELFDLSESIGFVDYEQLSDERIYFNGTLFRRNVAPKAKAVLDSLTAAEVSKLSEIDAAFNTSGCLALEATKTTLGEVLWSKLLQIGYLEVNTMTNEQGETCFVMKPSALAKYVPSGLADMLDDAKALASSFTYGIVNSFHARGKIRDPGALIGALISRGSVEGPVAAIRQDYQILERRGVVQVTTTPKGHNKLTLLKPEVGRMARDLILKGDANAVAAQTVVEKAAINFVGPEQKRRAERRNAIPESKSSVSRTLDILRKTIR
jgi:hypothetical protein